MACKQKSVNTILLVGTDSTVDRNIPFPFLLEKNKGSILLIDHKNKENARKHLEMARALLSEGYQMGEPYYEAFDEVFLYQIQDELDKT